MLSLLFCSEMRIAQDFDTTATVRLFEMSLTRQAYQQRLSASLLMLILRHKSTMVTDPRDTVYAFSGMAFDAGTTGYEGFEGLNIEPDYRLPIADVYLQFKEHTLALFYVPRDH